MSGSRGPVWAIVMWLAALGCTEPPSEGTGDATPMPPPPGSEYEGSAFAFDTVAPGVVHARGTGALSVGSNGTLVVNDEDVLLVDSHMTPAAAWALRREMQAVTDLPVRAVVNTHFHFDHTGGNQIFAPDADIIGHEIARRLMVAGYAFEGRSWQRFIGGIPAQIEAGQAVLDTATDEQVIAETRGALIMAERLRNADAAIVPTPPNITLAKRMTLRKGEREIRILFLGRGHTAGDVVVYLPAERVVITGDMVTGGIPYMGDAYLAEWAETLMRLDALDFDVIVPGHGPAVRDRAAVGNLAGYVADLWQQTEALHAMGVAVQDAIDRIDMSAHNQAFRNPRAGVNGATLERIYDLLNEAEEAAEITRPEG